MLQQIQTWSGNELQKSKQVDFEFKNKEYFGRLHSLKNNGQNFKE